MSMKTNITTLLLSVFATSLFMFTSCIKNNNDIGVDDNDNNDDIGIVYRMNNINDEVQLFDIDNAIEVYTGWVVDEFGGHYTDHYFTGSVCSLVMKGSTFRLYLPNNYGSNSYMFCDMDIACIGSVGSLRNINEIPETGWTDEVPVQPKNGYVARAKGYDKPWSYARIYVINLIYGEQTGNVIGATIRYEKDWNGSLNH